MKKIKLGLIGFGTIGTGVVDNILNQNDLISNRRGIELEFKYICDKDLTTDRGVKVDKGLLTDHWEKVVDDEEIDIIIELVGGVDLPFEIVSRALKNKKHVVTANKALLAKKGKEIFTCGRENQREIGFEASVAGGIPIIKVIKEALVSNNVESIYGIINGTTNYILTKMIDEKMSFEDALKKAQELGFAEADPTLDVNGGDAAAKLAILASLAFNTDISIDDVYFEGIENVALKDVEYASVMGYTVKLLAIASLDENDEVEARVVPCLVSNVNSLASVKNEFNAVMLDSDYLGRSMYYGKGAGSFPTASAVVADIVQIAESISTNAEYRPFRSTSYKNRKIKKMREINSRYYLRLNSADKAGVIAKVAGILGDRNISIAEVHQKETTKDIVSLVIVTHEAKEDDFLKCLAEIDALEDIKKESVFLRLID